MGGESRSRARVTGGPLRMRTVVPALRSGQRPSPETRHVDRRTVGRTAAGREIAQRAAVLSIERRRGTATDASSLRGLLLLGSPLSSSTTMQRRGGGGTGP
jgi:hypothetical protein